MAANSSNNAITLSISGAPTSVAIATAPSHGTATASGNSLRYTPTTDYAGNDSFTYTATNPAGTSTAATVTVTVTQISQTVSFTSSAPSNPVVGASYTPTATASSGLTPVVSVDNSSSSVCSISGGTVTFNATGTCLLDANQAGNATYSAATQAQQSMTVGKGSQTVGFTSTAPSSPVIGGSYSPTASASSGLTPTISVDSSSSSVCSMSGGTVTFNATGTCLLDANQAGNATYSAAPQVQQSVTVGRGSQTVSFTSSVPGTPVVGGTYHPTATATSGLTPTISVDGSSNSVCSISGGTVTFTAVGSCLLDANQAGNSTYSAAPQVQQTISVGRSAPGLTVSASSSAPTQGGAVTLSATLSGGNSPTGTITFKDGSTTLGTVALAAGVARYTSSTLTVGAHSITAIYSGDANNASITSAATSISVGSRANPSQNATANSQVYGQVNVASHFAKTQVSNTVSRLDQIHNLTAENSSSGQDASASGDTGSGSGASAGNGSTSFASSSSSGRSQSLDSQDSLFRPLALNNGSDSSGASRQIDPSLLVKQAVQGLENMEQQLGLPYHVWAEGAFDFGRLNVDGSRNNRFTSSGITVGIDGRLTSRLTTGLALGYGLDHSTYGSDGSTSDGTSRTASFYGSLRILPQTFIDFSTGYGRLHFDQRRWSEDGGVMLSGNRNGHELFQSLGASTVQNWGNVNLTSYGRADLAKVSLDGYRESGSDLWALRYDKMDSTSITAVGGAKLEYAFPVDWGQVIPGTRLEYRHTFDGGYTQSLSYADLVGSTYTITGTPTVRDTLTTELAVRAVTFDGVSFDLRYLLTASQNALESQQIRGMVRYAF